MELGTVLLVVAFALTAVIVLANEWRLRRTSPKREFDLAIGEIAGLRPEAAEVFGRLYDELDRNRDRHALVFLMQKYLSALLAAAGAAGEREASDG